MHEELKRAVEAAKAHPGEIWKPVVGFENLYEVSNIGRVKSLGRVIQRVSRWGTSSPYRMKPRLLRPYSDRIGGQRINLHDITGGVHARYVHRLMLEAFVGPCPEGMECCHNDGNPKNNTLPNLRWDTAAANSADMRRHGTLLMGEDAPWARLSDADIESICTLCNQGLPQSQIAKRFGVSQTYVSLLKRGQGRAARERRSA